MEPRQSRSDSPLVIGLLAAAMTAAGWPLLLVLKTIGGWPSDVIFPSYVMVLGVVVAACLADRIGPQLVGPGHRFVPVFMLGLLIRFVWYPGRHWASGGWLIEFISNALTLGHMLAVVLVLAAAWGGGVLISRTGARHDQAVVTLALGLRVAIAGCLLAGFALIREAPAMVSSVTAATAAYLVAGMATLSVARLEEMRRLQGRSARSLVQTWLPTAVITGLVVIVLSAAAASVVDPHVPRWFVAGLVFVRDIVATVLEFVIYPLVFVVAGLYYVLRYLVSLVKRTEVDPWEPIGGGPLEEIIAPGRSFLAGLDLRPVGAVVMLAAVAWILVWLLRHPRRQYLTDFGQVVEERSTASGARRSRKRRMVRRPAADDDELDPNRAAIRRAFRQVLAWLRRKEDIRPGDTALDVACRLKGLLPADDHPALVELVELYLPARYGTEQPGTADGERARRLAEHITRRPRS